MVLGEEFIIGRVGEHFRGCWLGLHVGGSTFLGGCFMLGEAWLFLGGDGRGWF